MSAAPDTPRATPAYIRMLSLVGPLLAGTLSRYGLVSVVALAADTGVYLNLTHAIGPTAASVVGYSFGLLVHYALSSRFVFPTRQGQRNHVRAFIGFLFTGVCGLAATAGTIFMLTHHFGASALAAKMFAVPAAFLLIYILRKFYVFGN